MVVVVILVNLVVMQALVAPAADVEEHIMVLMLAVLVEVAI